MIGDDEPGAEIAEIELEFLGLVGGIKRRAAAGRGDVEKHRCRGRPIAGNEGHAVRSGNAEKAEPSSRRLHAGEQVRIRQGSVAWCENGGCARP